MPASSRPDRANTAYVGMQQLQANLDGTAPWSGGLHAALGDGDPSDTYLQTYGFGPSTLATLTPTILTTTVARCWTYNCASPIQVNRVRWWGIGSVSTHRLAVYRLVDKVQVIGPLSLTMTSDAWNSASVAGITLAANVPYVVAFSTTTTGTTAGIRASGTPLVWPPLQATTPGSLALNLGANRFWYGQFAVTAGVLPSPLPTLVRGTGWTAGLPMFFFDSNSAT